MTILRLILIFGIIGIAEFYSFIVVRSALRYAPPGLRIALLSLYVLLTLLSWASMFILRQEHFNIPHSLRNIYFAFSLGMFMGKALILIVMLADDVRRAIIWAFYHIRPAAQGAESGTGKGISRSIFLSRLALLMGGGMVAGFIHGISNRYKYQVKRIKLSFANLPEAFSGLRIVQLSDIHSGSFDNPEAVNRGVQMVLDLKPDVIFFTGDLVNNEAKEMKTYQQIFSRLQAPMGVYSTLGNHDYGDYLNWPDRDTAHLTREAAAGKHLMTPLQSKDVDQLMQVHAAMGWRLLMDESVRLERNGQSIGLIGVQNISALKRFHSYGNLPAAYAGAADQPFKILLSHDPSHWDMEVNTLYKDIDLTLSGHTHGMQFGIEIPWIKWSPSQYIFKQWAGLYKNAKQYLYVNRGFGFLGYPGRFGIMPEITLIELVKA
jgi:predicted MPP superfamily phosphohydrolase